MKKVLLFFALITALAFGETQKVEVGLFSPTQIGAPTDDVDGFRLSIIYTENKNVSGFDWTWIASKTTGTFDGFKLGGFYNSLEKGGNVNQFLSLFTDIKGNSQIKQVGVGISMVEKAEGFRALNFVNYAGSMKGTDIGAINYANHIEGLQIGIFNYALHLDGFQVGLINYAKNSSIFPVLPFFNKGE